MKKLLSKMFAVTFIESMGFCLQSGSSKKLLQKALAVRHGMPMPASRTARHQLRVILISLAACRWLMGLLSGGDARLERKLAKLDKRLRWSKEAFGLLLSESDAGPDEFFGADWWSFIEKGHRYTDSLLQFLAEGPQKLYSVGVGWYFWEVFGCQELGAMEARLEAEARQKFDEFKFDESAQHFPH